MRQFSRTCERFAAVSIVAGTFVVSPFDGGRLRNVVVGGTASRRRAAIDKVDGGMRRTDGWTDKWRLRRRGKWLQQHQVRAALVGVLKQFMRSKTDLSSVQNFKGFLKECGGASGIQIGYQPGEL